MGPQRGPCLLAGTAQVSRQLALAFGSARLPRLLGWISAWISTGFRLDFDLAGFLDLIFDLISILI